MNKELKGILIAFGLLIAGMLIAFASLKISGIDPFKKEQDPKIEEVEDNIVLRKRRSHYLDR